MSKKQGCKGTSKNGLYNRGGKKNANNCNIYANPFKN